MGTTAKRTLSLTRHLAGRKGRLASALAGVLVLFFVNHCVAQAQGGHAVTILVPYAAGGISDTLARKVAPHLALATGQTVIVENITGASGTIAARKLLAAPVDGNTLMVVSSSETIMPPLLMANVKYAAKDFRLLVDGMRAPMVLLARPSLGLNTVEELLSYAHNPINKPLTYGSLGIGSIAHLAAEHFQYLTKTKMVQVPYRGGIPLVTDLMTDQLDIGFLPMGATIPHMVRAGKLRILGATSRSKMLDLREAPLLTEFALLKTFSYSAWASFAIAKGVARPIAIRLNSQLNQILQMRDIKAFAESMGSQIPPPSSLNDIESFYQDEIARTQSLARTIRLNAE